ncbi:hypothetical protein T484DRAFT_1871375 [Baffinella frigidus]|nr:hypothetical protein T484DRAFT_1871375 [Cryptophyta sp. CCMP2293]
MLVGADGCLLVLWGAGVLGRECLYPEVARDVHIGEVGANMDALHFKRSSLPLHFTPPSTRTTAESSSTSHS